VYINIAFDSLRSDILQAKTPGYIRMLTRSHRFVVSMQADRFTPPVAELLKPEKRSNNGTAKSLPTLFG